MVLKNINQHTSQQFNEELESIMSQIMTMGGFVERQFRDAVDALINRDIALADHVSEKDSTINKMEVDIMEDCVKIIAKRQPTARDLRLLIVIIKVSAELERVGDIARRLSKLTKKAVQENHQPIPVDLGPIIKVSSETLHDVLNAFARMDLQEAVRLDQKEEEMDWEYETVIQSLTPYMMENPSSISAALLHLSCARAFERIGDRCQNICESIVYFVKGEDIRYKGKKAILIMLKEQFKEQNQDKC